MALTDTEIDAKAEDWLNVSSAGPDAKLFRDFARAIEAAAVAPLLERIVALEAQVEQAAQPFADPFTYVIQHLNSNPYALTKDECIEKIKELRVLYTSPPKAAPLTEEQREVLSYLDGSGPIDGLWFGDKHPTEQGAYWWRKRLWAAFGTPATVEKEG